MTVRTATTEWQGDLQSGTGVVALRSSGAVELPVTFPARTGEPEGMTSPEELIAAAHSACYSMSLSGALTRAGTPPTALSVSAEVELGRDDAGLAIVAVRLTVEGTVPGATPEAFQDAALAAKAGCPVSKALAGVPAISVTATLR